MKIKIIEPGFAGYTGLLGSVEFVDGISVDDVSNADKNQIGSVLRCETVDGDQVGIGVVVAASKGTSMAIQNDHTMTEEAKAEVVKDEEVKSSEPAADKNKKVYTQVELEAVADGKGIAGLREIAESMGVKGRAISDLIENILKAQVAEANNAPLKLEQ